MAPEDGTDDDLWVETATEEEVKRHVERVREIFAEYGVSPASTPSTSGSSSPTSSLEGDEEEDVGGGRGMNGSASAGARPQFEPLRLPGASSAGSTRAPTGSSGGQPQTHRRNSSLITKIVQKDGKAQGSQEVKMNSTIFSKMMEKTNSLGTSRPDGLELGGIPESEESQGASDNEAVSADQGTNDASGDLISPFLDSLYEAEQAELAWLKPQGAGSGEAPEGGDAETEGAPEGGAEPVLSLENMAISKNSWFGSIDLNVEPEEGSPCILSSRTLPGSTSVLTLGTSTGTVLAKSIRELSKPLWAPTARCEPPAPQPQEKNCKITSLATSFGLDNYVAVGYSNGAIALYDTSDLGDAQESEKIASQAMKVIRQPETKDNPITSLGFTFCRQQSGDQPDASEQNRQKSLRGTAKAAIGAMGMGRVCTFLACSANGLVCSHSVSVMAPTVSFLRRTPVISVSTKIRGRLDSAILDCSLILFPGGVLAAIVMQNGIMVVQLPLSENQESAQMVTLGKVSKPANTAFGAVPCVCWRIVSAQDSVFELLVSWDCIVQSVSVKPKLQNEVEEGQSFVDILHEWRVEQSVASMHWLDNSNMLAVCSEHGHVTLSTCQDGHFHQGLDIIESLLLPESPVRQVASHERSFHGSTLCLSSSMAGTSNATLEGQTAFSVVCNNGKIVYLLLLSPLSRAIALFSKNATTPAVALKASLEMLSGKRDENRAGLHKQILVTLDATMRKDIHEKNYDLAARTTFSACLAIAESQVKDNEISMLDDSVAIREFLWQDAFSAFSESESSISAFTRALEEAIMKQVGAHNESMPGSETIRVPPEVMQKLVESLSSHPERIERCVIQMPIFCLDFNQVAKLCILHNLHTAFAYLYNEGLRDALTPAVEMIRGLLKCEARDSQRSLMRKFCVYAAYCFQGRRYPPADRSNTLDVGQPAASGNENEPLTDLVQKEEQLHAVRAQLLKLLLLCPISKLLQPGMPTPLLSSSDLLNGPVIRLMLRLDSCLCLSMLLCAFETWDAVSSDIFEASIQLEAAEGPLDGADSNSTALQLAVDVLSREAEECERLGSHGMADAGCVWMFVAHEVASGRARFGSSTGAELLARVLEHLCLAASTLQELKRKESFERAALRLVDEWWDINCSPDHAERISKLALNTKFYLLCAKVRMLCGDYEGAIDFLLTYMGEVAEKDQEVSSIRHKRCEATFRVLNDLLSIEGRGRALARQAVTSKLKDFTRIDGTRTAQLIGALQNSGSGPGAGGGQFLSAAEDLENKILIENYIDAICQIDPDSVLVYLQRNEGRYRLDSVLRTIMRSPKVETFRCDDAAVYLLERLGDIMGGLDIILGVVRGGLSLLSAKVTESTSSSATGRADVHLIAEGRATRECLKAAFELNFRNSQLLDAPELEELWFKILATFVNPAHDAALAAPEAAGTGSKEALKEMQSFLSTCVRDTIMAMSDAMPLTRVAARLVQEHSGSSLSSFREILSDLLQACGHDVDVLATAKRVFETQQRASRHAKWVTSRGRVRPRELRVARVDGAEGGQGGLRTSRGSGGASWLSSSGGAASFLSTIGGDETHHHLHLAPPPGSEHMVAHGGGTSNITAATTRVVGAFPQRAQFHGELVG
ncbi:hypothetical protein A3770_05p38170 [Chloropicon primus]|uniref:Vacuolar protein sorting-associated protein 8 central domain-containing protein n=3 Tax=Chloropicon primus TaxID=1764295 RepID=A0A5B8MLJ6_9CHLO|nr:hypothetical protein A3770_05p38170 [Chloropicon primus]|eukprot:QDZ21299.1 hypothetical protein A3770_05p38170 [Chloropicon primus]